MLIRLFATAVLIAVTTLVTLPSSVSSAPPGPPGDSPKACIKHGEVYPHGTLYYSPVYFNRTLIRYDVYRCVDGTWVYDHSSDDKN